MNCLLDTHIALWLAIRREHLNFREIRFIDNLDNRMFVSAVSLWELRIKWQTFSTEGDRKGPADPRHVMIALDRLGVTLLPVAPTTVVASLHDPISHRDPFDEQLLIEAQERQLRLLTRDEKLLRHALTIVPE